VSVRRQRDEPIEEEKEELPRKKRSTANDALLA